MHFYFHILSGILSNMLSGILSGVCSDILSGILLGMCSGPWVPSDLEQPDLELAIGSVVPGHPLEGWRCCASHVGKGATC